MRDRLTKEEKKIKRQSTARQPKTWLLYVLLFVGLFGFYLAVTILDTRTVESDMSFYEFSLIGKEGRIVDIEFNISGDTIAFTYVYEGNYYHSTAWNPRTDTSRDFIGSLENVQVRVYSANLVERISQSITPFLMMSILILIMIRLSKYTTKSIEEISTVIPVKDLTDFESIKGLDEVKDELKGISKILKCPEELQAAGARPVRGILLHGPPGVGKTMLAKALAKESGLKFIATTGSDFSSMFSGVGGMKLKALFKLARFNMPCVIFIDEIEGLAAKRDFRGEVSRDNTKTLNILLSEMDGLQSSRGILVIGATNHKEILDPAILRGGRLERHVYVNHSGSLKDTKSLVGFYMKGNQDESLIEDVSVLLQGRSPAEIENILNLAVFERLNDEAETMEVKHVDRALSKVITGGYPREYENKHDLRTASAHEAGHVVMAMIQRKKVLKATALQHGVAGGYVLLATPEHKFQTEEDMKKQIYFLLAGLVAEEILFGEGSLGYQDDFEKASEIVRLLVDRLGMSGEKVLREKEDSNLEEKDKLMSLAKKQTKELLANHKDLLRAVANELENKKTLYEADLTRIAMFRLEVF